MEKEIKSFFEGDVENDERTLAQYSRDASLFEVRPKLVLSPKDSKDIEKIVKYVLENKSKDPTLSVTVRAAGSCMSGGPLNDSIILDVTKYMGGILNLENREATVLPGTFYRDFETETLKKSLILPCYTASKNLCAIGGMIGNNAAGEKTLRYGKMENYIKSLKIVFSDGKEYVVTPLSKGELDRKILKEDFEGNLYKQIWNLIQKNAVAITNAKPKVSKNSAGYYIWNVWDGEIFDLTKLIVGSQGTLGIVTEATVRLVFVKAHTKLAAIFLKDLSGLSQLVNDVLKLHPESLESYDDNTLKLAFKFFPEMLKSMKAKSFLKLMISFLPEAAMLIKGGFPKLVILVEFTADDKNEIDEKMKLLKKIVKGYDFPFHIAKSKEDSEKYWTIRRESFNLLRKHIRGKRTAPFVDDVVVEPRYLPEFLPKMRKILDEYRLTYTIAGHAGNGNFHIIPLMDMTDPKNKDVILDVSEKIFNLVGQYHGSITGEHNDGIVRTPFLGKMYSSRTLEIFREIKDIFDPQNIFNPGKKVDGTKEYLKNHIVNS